MTTAPLDAADPNAAAPNAAAPVQTPLRKLTARQQLIEATRRRLSIPFRLWLWLEMLVIFVGAPLAAEFAVRGSGIPLFLVLGALFFVIGLLISIDPLPIWRVVIGTMPSPLQLLHILSVFAILGSCIGLYVFYHEPRWRFMNFPESNPEIYARVMFFYPILSVVSQELMFRVFFFERYAVLFGRQVWLLILVNGVLFGYAHIIFGNWISIVLCTIGGIIFAWRYH
ncbi:MAG: CPBP family intramembrane glutamic endopeptidase, partial [Pseudomonadota bacterium]